jgi:hypothetical protein
MRLTHRRTKLPDPRELISVPEAAEATGRPARVLLAQALRRHDEIPVCVQPVPPGWRAVLLRGEAGGRTPRWREHFPSPFHDALLTDPILLSPDVLRTVLATGSLDRVTLDGLTVGATREEVGYTRWSMARDGVLEYEPESAETRSYLEVYALCEGHSVPLEALLIPRSALDLLRVEAPPSAPPRARPGSTDEAASVLGISRDTLDRMRKQQRREGWRLPGDPVQMGQGKTRKHERWDLDRVGEWAAAFHEHRSDKPRPKPRRSRRQPRGPKNQAAAQPTSRTASHGSLYARAKAKVAGRDSKG